MCTVSAHNVRDLLEYMYFLSGPALAVSAIYGLKQLSITRNNAKLTAKREALKITADQCAIFHNVISPLMDELDFLLESPGCTIFKTTEVKLGDDYFEAKIVENDVKDEEIKILRKAIEITNALDALSIYFTSGVGDEHLASTIIGASFCRQVETLLPIIALGRKNHYKHLVHLFFLWRRRYLAEALRTDHADLVTRLEKLKDKKIRVVGD